MASSDDKSPELKDAAGKLESAGLKSTDIEKVLSSPAGRQIAASGSPAELKTFAALFTAAKSGAPVAMSVLTNLAKNTNVQTAIEQSPQAAATFVVTLAKSNPILSPDQVGEVAKTAVVGSLLGSATAPSVGVALARFMAPLVRSRCPACRRSEISRKEQISTILIGIRSRQARSPGKSWSREWGHPLRPLF